MVRNVLNLHLAAIFLLGDAFSPSSFELELLLIFYLLDDLSSVDLYLFEDVGLVGLSLDLDGFVDHLA